MSDRDERIKALEEAFTSDEVFATEFSRAIKMRSAEDAIRLAAAKGIEITADDFAPNAAALESRELDESELKTVAGGYSWGQFAQDLGCYAYFFLAAAAWE